MEHDEILKKLLALSAEPASEGFTNTIMQRIDAVNANAYVYKSLVSKKTERLFITVFCSVVLLIFITCFMISVPDFSINNLNIFPHDFTAWYNTLVFIGCFWLVFAINALVKKIRWKIS